jgi:hypothetical protein
MALVQFESEHKRFLARFKQKPNLETSKCLLAMDQIAKQLAAKDLKPNDHDALVNKLKDQFKKLKLAIKDDLKERDAEHAQEVKTPPENFDVQSATRTWQNIRRELLLLQRKAQHFAETGGTPPPPPKLPTLHFGADYKKVIVEYEGTLSPSVVTALSKLDSNSDASKAMDLLPHARELVKKQLASVAAEINKSRDPKEKMRWTNLCKGLSKFEKALDEFENYLFLINRMKG